MALGAGAWVRAPLEVNTSRVTSGQNPDVMDVLSHPAENGSPPALQSHIQSHIQSKMADLQPSSHVREKSGAICKIHAKYSARAARSLAMQIRKSLAESHPRVTSMQISEDESHFSTSQSHPGVTSAKNSEASHIRWSHPRVTSGQNPVTSTWVHEIQAGS